MKLRNSITFLAVALFGVFAFTSCIKEETAPNSEREKIALDAWIRLHKPELVGNYQENGGYYVEILDGDKNDNNAASGNDFGSEPIMEQDTCWVFTNMTGRDMNGAICMTRDYKLADLCGTFSYFTHYAPYINYGGNINLGLLEGTYLSMRNALKVNGSTYRLHKGSKVRLYLPSVVAYGESGSSIEGGYEGQYALDSSRPLMLDIEVLSVIKNPSDLELEMVKSYIGIDPQWKQATKSESEKTDENDDLKLTGLYYQLDCNPDKVDTYDYHKRYIQPHQTGLNNPYEDNKNYAPGKMAEMNQKINEILVKRFGAGLTASERTEQTQVTKNGRVKVWYMVRLMDGFVVDTNIAEIREYVFNEQNPTCEVFSYSPSDDDGKAENERQAIGAWYYCIPQMHYGAYGQIVTTSGYAYGAAGLSGTTTSETTSTGTASYYNAMNYYNYYNSYYNSYYNPYYNYYDYNYYNYNYNYDTESETTTKITISTEILPYTPLVFTLYVEPFE